MVAVAGAAYWAGTTAVLPPELPIEEHSVQTYEVRPGTIERVEQVAVSAAWTTERIVAADSDGLVTSVVHPAGASAPSGAVLLTVDLEPLVVARGAVPMFRSLESGVEGPDVAQFQALLVDLGIFSGPVDGRFDVATGAAATRWQQSVGAEADGIVETGALVFVEDLPARVVVLAEVAQRVSPGIDLVRVLAERPEFVATVSASQGSDLTSGSAIEIDAPGGAVWDGVLGATEQLDDGRYAIEISGTLCGEDCDLVPVSGELALRGTVELLPETTGLVVPVSALTLQPTGALTVTLSDGGEATVRMVAEDDGFAIVEGIESGTRIRLPPLPSP